MSKLTGPATDRVVIDLRTDPPMALVGPMTRVECEEWIRANPHEGSQDDLAILPQSLVESLWGNR